MAFHAVCLTVVLPLFIMTIVKNWHVSRLNSVVAWAVGMCESRDIATGRLEAGAGDDPSLRPSMRDVTELLNVETRHPLDAMTSANATCGFLAGIDVLFSRHAGWLRGQRVGLLSHQAALDRQGATSAQRLRRELGSRLVALFGPEHGFLGQAGAGVATASRRHPDWGIPVHSLYGPQRRPTPAMLRGVDVVVCDLQDLGARCYTYLATLRELLLAANEAGVCVVVADRPVPLPGVFDGPTAEAERLSFVAPVRWPMCTGLTPGEAARAMALREAPGLDLRVAPVQGWDRLGPRGPDWPDWLPPSPGIRTWESAMTYLVTVFSEALPGIDCGRGTNLAFRVVGAPWLRAERVCGELEAFALPGVSFHPHRYVAGTEPHAGRELDGIRIAVTEPLRFRPVRTAVTLLHVLQRLYGPARVWRHRGVRQGWFDQLFATSRTRVDLQRGRPPSAIAAAWRSGLEGHAAAYGAVRLYEQP